jgi:hypothetical protein
MVHVYGKNAPVVLHDSLDDAVKEATRLALKERTEVRVLQVIAVGHPPTTEVQWSFASNLINSEDEEEVCEDCGERHPEMELTERGITLAESLTILLEGLRRDHER